MGQPNAKLGIKCKLYLNTGTYAAPFWLAANCISDFTQTPEWEMADILTRFTRVKMGVKTALGLTWTGKAKVSDTDAAYLVLKGALLVDDSLDVVILNGLITGAGTTGYRLDVQVMKAVQDQGPAAVLFDEFLLMPTPVARLLGTGGAGGTATMQATPPQIASVTGDPDPSGTGTLSTGTVGFTSLLGGTTSSQLTGGGTLPGT